MAFLGAQLECIYMQMDIDALSDLCVAEANSACTRGRVGAMLWQEVMN